MGFIGFDLSKCLRTCRGIFTKPRNEKLRLGNWVLVPGRLSPAHSQIILVLVLDLAYEFEDEDKNESPMRAVAFPAPAARHVYRLSAENDRKLRRSDTILRGVYAAPTELGFVGVARL